jgi:hypothetical protein
MANVMKTSTGYIFECLNAAGMKLVNEFQRQHPQICEPSSEPTFRFIRCGSAEDNLALGELIAEVRAMTLADEIREFALKQYVEPVRRTKTPRTAHVTIVSGNIVRELKLRQRTPAVCSAIDAQKFQDDNGIQLLQRSGPKHGMTVTWNFLV